MGKASSKQDGRFMGSSLVPVQAGGWVARGLERCNASASKTRLLA